MADLFVDADKFALSLESILKDVSVDVDSATMRAARKASKRGVKTVQRYAGSSVRKGMASPYVQGFSSTSNRKKTASYAEIGNKDYPGLVHLLEKGHATIGGGRVAARPHMALAAPEIFTDFEKQLDKEIDETL